MLFLYWMVTVWMRPSESQSKDLTLAIGHLILFTKSGSSLSMTIIRSPGAQPRGSERVKTPHHMDFYTKWSMREVALFWNHVFGAFLNHPTVLLDPLSTRPKSKTQDKIRITLSPGASIICRKKLSIHNMILSMSVHTYTLCWLVAGGGWEDVGAHWRRCWLERPCWEARRWELRQTSGCLGSPWLWPTRLFLVPQAFSLYGALFIWLFILHNRWHSHLFLMEGKRQSRVGMFCLPTGSLINWFGMSCNTVWLVLTTQECKLTHVSSLSASHATAAVQSEKITLINVELKVLQFKI